MKSRKTVKSVSLALIISFNILNISPSFAAAKVNGPCTKAKTTTALNGVNLTCTKVGNKLIWIKQLSDSSYAIGASGRLVYQYVGAKQQRLNAKSKWQTSDSRSESSFDPIRVAAYTSINGLPTDETHPNISFDYLTQPFYPKDLAAAIKLQSINVAKKMSPLLDKNLQIKLILVTEKNKSFIGNDLNKIIPNPDWLGQLEILNDYVTVERFYSRGGTGGGTAFYLKDKGYAYYLGHTSSLATLKTYWPEVAPHELAHVLQGVLSNGSDPGNQQYSEGSPLARWQGHLIEGSANTLGMAWGFEQLGWYSDEMDFLLKRDIQGAKGKITMKSEADAVKFMQTIESRNNEFGGFAYSAGQIIWEYYVGKYGVSKLVELYKNLPETDNFNANLKKTIGKDRDQFYQEAAPYFLSVWKRLS
jgi:hypothetical protein